MSDRLTPEQIILNWPTTIHPGSPRAISNFVAHAEVPDIIPALEAAGFVIVHPDDVPPLQAASEVGTSFANGWNECRDFIFGGDQ